LFFIKVVGCVEFFAPNFFSGFYTNALGTFQLVYRYIAEVVFVEPLKGLFNKYK